MLLLSVYHAEAELYECFVYIYTVYLSIVFDELGQSLVSKLLVSAGNDLR